ncbi:MAG: cytochrome c [Rhizobiaceae bacterium]
MRAVIAVGLVVLLALLGSAVFVYSGIYSVAATDRHWGLTAQIFEAVRIRSIRTHAAGIQVPPNLDKTEKLVMGVDHFAAHCAVCHGGPGVPKGDIGKGLYPSPPDLAHTSQHLSDAEMFWVIKNGLKMTGMPAWSDHSDDEIWATVAFLKKLPGMTPEDYAKLIMASMQHGGHRHSTSDQGAASPPAEQSPPSNNHRH